MGPCKATGLWVLALLATCNALPGTFPKGKELIYDYEALVKAGTMLPISHASQFMLKGKMHMQVQDKEMMMKLTDLKYEMYNGIMNHHNEHMESKDVPVPPEVAELNKPFKMMYDDKGMIKKLMMDKSEKMWSMNMKKAMASIMQMEWKKVKSDKKPHAFMTKEHSIYGLNDVQYNVLYPEPSMMKVQKMIMLPTTDNLMTHSITPKNKDECEAPMEETIARESQRKYTIKEENGVLKMMQIESNGLIMYAPFNGKSEAQYIFVNQTMKLKEEMDIKEAMAIQTPMEITDLSYTVLDESKEYEKVPPMTMDRRTIDNKKLVPMIMKKIEGVWAYLQKNHLHLQTPNLQEGQQINQLKVMMTFLDCEGLKELQTEVLTKPTAIKKIFYQLLPLIGSKATSMLILKVIQDNSVDAPTMLDMLYKFPKHVVAPKQDMIIAMEGLMNLDEKTNWEIRKAAMMAFANLIKSSYNYAGNMLNYKNGVEEYVLDNNIENDVHSDLKSNKTLMTFYEKYVLIYVNKLKSAKTFEEQMAYMYGLSNMQMDIILPHLLPIVKGELWSDHHHRLVALWASASTLASEPVEAYNILWPIFSNKMEHTEMRVAAYWLLMEYIGDLPLFMNVYWTMRDDPNMELYSFHYHYMKSLATRKDPCYSQMQKYASKVLKYMNPPMYDSSMYDVMDFTDIKYKWGMGVHGMLVTTNESVIMTGFLSSHIFNIYHDEFFINIKVHGINYWNPLDITSEPKENTYTLKNEVLKLFSGHETDDNVHFEVIIAQHGQILDSWYIDSKDLKDITKVPLFMLMMGYSYTDDEVDIDISYERYSKTIIPTDLGMPAFMQMLMPSVQLADETFSKSTNNKMLNFHINNKYITWTHAKHGLTLYNSIMDVWQGISKYHSFDSYFPFLMDVSLNMEQENIKFSLKKHGDNMKDLWGLRSHVTSLVYVRDDMSHDVLKASSPSAENFVMVSAGDKYRHDYPLMHKDDLFSGRIWDVMVYDSEHSVSNGSWGYAKQMMAQPWTKNFDDPIEYLSLVTMSWYSYIFMAPETGTHGLMIRITPKPDVSSVDLTLRWNMENFDDTYEYSIGGKYSSRMTYAVKNQETSLKTWDVNTILEMNPGNTVRDLKMFITRIIPGQKDYKICLEGVKKWSATGVSGHLNIAMGQSEDGKCVKNDATIDVTMKGEMSEEQKDKTHIPKSCQYPMPYNVKPYHTWQCLYAYSSIRKYEYDMKTKNIPSTFKNYYLQFMDIIKSYNMPYFNWEHEHDMKVDEHNVKAEITYPMSSNVVDMKVWTKENFYSLTGMPMSEWGWVGFYPDSLMYPPLFLMEYWTGDLFFMTIDHNMISWYSPKRLHKEQAISKNWAVYLSDAKDKPTLSLSVKEVSDKFMGLQIVSHEHTLTVIPSEGSWQMMADGKPCGEGTETMGWLDWVHWNKVGKKGLVKPALVLMLPKSGLFVEFDGSTVEVLMPSDKEWHGLSVF